MKRLASLLVLFSATAFAAPPDPDPSTRTTEPAKTEPAAEPAAPAGDAALRRAVEQLRAEVVELTRRVGENQARVAETTDVTGGPRVRLGYDGALYLRMPRVSIELNTGVQLRYTGQILQRLPNTSGFDVHHAELLLRSSLLGWLDVGFMLDFGADYMGGGNARPVRDAYLDVNFIEAVSLRAGQFQLPFGRQRLILDLRQLFIERSLATRSFTPDRDVGVMLLGRFFDERLLFDAAVSDGIDASTQTHNDNLDLRYTAHLLAQPLGAVPLIEGGVERSPSFRFAVGGAFQYDLVPVDAVNHLNAEVMSVDVEAAARLRGFSLDAEYFFRHERAGGGTRSHDYHGVYAQLGAAVWRGLQLAARYGYSQPHALQWPKLGLAGDVPRDAHEVSGLISWSGWHENLKAQLVYTFRRDTPAAMAMPMAPPMPVQLGSIIEAQLQAGF